MDAFLGVATTAHPIRIIYGGSVGDAVDALTTNKHDGVRRCTAGGMTMPKSIVVKMLKPPDETLMMPPKSVVSSIVPPDETSSTPPLLTVSKKSTWPEETV